MVINKENIEEYLLLLVDGELSAAEETEVMAFVEMHDEYKLLLEQFLETKLEVEIFPFEGKESLLKEETKILPFKKNKLYMAWAAGVAAIIGISILLKMISGDKVSTDNSVINHSVAFSKKDTVNKNIAAIHTAGVTKEKHINPVRHLVIKQAKENKVIVPTDERVQVDEIQPLVMADYKAMDVEQDNATPVKLVPSSMQVMIAETNKETDNAFVNADKLDLFNELADELSSVKNNVKEKVKSIRISSFAISFGNKEYTIVK